MPHLKKAELIEGVVYMPSPVNDVDHGHPHFNVIGWLAQEVKATIPDNHRVIAGPHVAGGMTMPAEVIVEAIQKALGRHVTTLAGRGS